MTASVLPHPYDKIDSDFDEIAYQTHIHLAEADDDAVAGFVAVDESSVADSILQVKCRQMVAERIK